MNHHFHYFNYLDINLSSFLLIMCVAFRHNVSQNALPHLGHDDPTSTITYCDTFVPKNETNLWKYKYMFIFAQLFHGMGATPLYTLGVTYLDENLKTKVTPVYVGELNIPVFIQFFSWSVVGVTSCDHDPIDIFLENMNLWRRKNRFLNGPISIHLSNHVSVIIQLFSKTITILNAT